jgi:hypothetical protein
LRRAFDLLALATAVLAIAAVGIAQEPPPPPDAEQVSPGPEFSSLALPTDPTEEALGGRRQHYRAARLLLALPTTGRAQTAIYEEGRCACLLEMNDGGALSPFAVVGLAAGGRVDFTLAGDGVRSGLAVGPGVDLWANSPAREAVLAPTLDLSVRHDLWSQCHWNLGLNVGAGYFYGRANDYGFPRLFPLLGLSTGLRF